MRKYRKMYEDLAVKYAKLDEITMVLVGAVYDADVIGYDEEVDNAVKAFEAINGRGEAVCPSCGCLAADAWFGALIDGGEHNGWCLTCSDREDDVRAEVARLESEDA